MAKVKEYPPKGNAKPQLSARQRNVAESTQKKKYVLKIRNGRETKKKEEREESRITGLQG